MTQSLTTSPATLRPERSATTVTGRINQVMVTLFQIMAFLVFLAIPLLANSWLNTPFLGAFVENTLLFNDANPTRGDSAWSLRSQGIGFHYQLVSIAGTEIVHVHRVQQVLAQFSPGQSVPVTVRTPTGPLQNLVITLRSFPTADRLGYYLVPFVTGLVYLVSGFWVFSLRRSHPSGRAFTLFAASAAIASGGLFDLLTTNRLTYLWTLSIAMAGASLFHLSLVFPQESRLHKRLPFLSWAGYLVAFGLAGFGATTLYNLQDRFAHFLAWRMIAIFIAVGMLTFLVTLVYRRLSSPSPIIRQQAQVVVVSAGLSFTPLLVWLVGNSFLQFSPYLLFSLVFFPIALGYTIMRYRLLQIDYLISRGLLYGVLTVMAGFGYALAIIGLSVIFSQTFDPGNPLLIGLMVLMLVLAINPLRNRLQQVIDTVFFRGQSAYEQHLRDFEQELTTLVDLSSISRSLRQYVLTGPMPDRLHIYIYDVLSDQYAAVADESGRPTSDLRFSARSALVRLLTRERLPLYIDQNLAMPELQQDAARLSLLGAHLFVPLPGRDRLAGWLALGARRSNENYSTQDLNYLEALSKLAAQAIERTQIVFNMERRVQEMNVLTRVSQGINITLHFDDTLELIYAQTNQIIPASDFHITLYNDIADHFYHAFFLEDNERLGSHENVPLPTRQGLNQQVIAAGQPIQTTDYQQECQQRNATPTSLGIYAWMGVPLRTGAETIGALSVGSRDPGVTYTAAQQELLQAIADQAAAAIVKARLLQETEQRAHQLSTLNVITRQLTSTLESEPLLSSILESATGILNAEAGSLFLVDEQTGDLVFKVTAGPVASNLVGQRLPAGAGFAGQAVEARQPIIVNDVQAHQQASRTERQTGFITRAILAVPMVVKDKAVGVIEVINKRDGLPFTEDDQGLLMAFAAQAAVALENARLYTLTDQELNRRVEELSVMQRIDRELNASLEVDRAMRITLEWAMRQSAAGAGFIGVVEESGVRLMAEEGYGDQLARYREDWLPIDHPAFKTAIETGQAQRVTASPEDDNRNFFSREAYSQIVIPIRREATAIGILLLESSSPEQFHEDTAFLTRLSDHAAIAIANAQLYSAVQSANDAKSEFVSFVAHELKNPMTSIKGYTELLAAGAVGGVNDMQANFLSTIRSNVERMSTLVSDLNDNSKIEAGRLRLDFRPVDLGEVVDEVSRSTRRQVEDKMQTLEVKIPDDLPHVWADRVRVAQVLTNLVSNAHKYTPEGGAVVIGAEKSANHWNPNGAPEVVHIWVKDNGIGINREDQQKIFQKFFRSDDAKAREAPGTGLGLNITHSLVEMQGGSIWFESEFRQGTTFHITIPVSET